MSLKISISGIRGIVGRDLDAEIVTRFASAYGQWLAEGPVVVARDSRPSGPMVSAAVSAALMSTGHDVIDAGILTTPGTEYLVQTTDAVGGVIVTASHNPVEWNALKLLRHDGLFLGADEMDAVVALSNAPTRAHRAALQNGTLRFDTTAEQLHLEAILALDLVEADAVRAAKLRVVVDCVEGAGGSALPKLLRAMGVEVIELGCGLSGHFPHDPEPCPDHLQELARLVAEHEADLGLAVDPDVDRLAMVDRGGLAVSEERTLMVAADHVLALRTGPVVVNLSTTLAMERVAAAHGVAFHRTPVGEANVVHKMLAEKAVVGGEGNGGVILPELHPGRDALLGAALVLSAVARAGSLRACLERYPDTFMLKDKLALSSKVDDPALWERALRALGDGGRLDETDGLKYDLGDRWVHLRRSNTENALRIIVEALDAATAKSLLEDTRSRVQAGA